MPEGINCTMMISTRPSIDKRAASILLLIRLVTHIYYIYILYMYTYILPHLSMYCSMLHTYSQVRSHLRVHVAFVYLCQHIETDRENIATGSHSRQAGGWATDMRYRETDRQRWMSSNSDPALSLSPSRISQSIIH